MSYAVHELLVTEVALAKLLTLVIDQTLDPTTWIIVTGWSATNRERILLEGTR